MPLEAIESDLLLVIARASPDKKYKGLNLWRFQQGLQASAIIVIDAFTKNHIWRIGLRIFEKLDPMRLCIRLTQWSQAQLARLRQEKVNKQPLMKRKS